VLPGRDGTAVFMATRGKVPKLAHERTFSHGSDPLSYARQLSTRFGCSIIAPPAAIASSEDAA
jgi:hypothetical protein